MKSETIHYKIQQSVRLSGKELKAIHKSYCEKWGDKPIDELMEEEILIEAISIGLIELPEGWSAN